LLTDSTIGYLKTSSLKNFSKYALNSTSIFTLEFDSNDTKNKNSTIKTKINLTSPYFNKNSTTNIKISKKPDFLSNSIFFIDLYTTTKSMISSLKSITFGTSVNSSSFFEDEETNKKNYVLKPSKSEISESSTANFNFATISTPIISETIPTQAFSGLKLMNSNESIKNTTLTYKSTDLLINSTDNLSYITDSDKELNFDSYRDLNSYTNFRLENESENLIFKITRQTKTDHDEKTNIIDEKCKEIDDGVSCTNIDCNSEINLVKCPITCNNPICNGKNKTFYEIEF
jgi:hypothetical protein